MDTTNIKKCRSVIFLAIVFPVFLGNCGEVLRTTPFDGKPHVIPGNIEAENFDNGEEGVAYYDNSPGNEGGTNGFRAGGVDIEACEEASGGHSLGWVRAGEWLVYTVEVKATGTYSIEAAVASEGKGGTFHIEFDGQDKTGPMRVPDSKNAETGNDMPPNWSFITKTGVKLAEGRHSMRVIMGEDGQSGEVGEIDFFRFIEGIVATRREPEPEISESRRNKVSVQIFDTETGEITSAMVCITDTADGSVRLPPDGRVQTSVSRLVDFERGIPYDPDAPDWIGPVRMMLGTGDNEDRASVFDPTFSSIPYWKEPVMYQTTGRFSIDLPDGHWRLAVSRGMEYIPVTREFETSNGSPLDIAIQMNPWINMAERGWYSGDTHVHHPTESERDREYLLAYAAAEDLHVLNMLEWSDHLPPSHRLVDLPDEFIDDQGKLIPVNRYKVNGFGKRFRANRGDYWLVSGQEDSNHFGCIQALNIDTFVPHTEATDGFCDLFYEGWASSKEAVIGLSHFGSWMHLRPGNAWTVTTGHVEFVELMQFRQSYTQEYYDYLNLGFRLAAAAGSDAFWGSTIGEVRVYVYTGTPLNIDLWFANLKKGRSFATNGPMLEFTVDGQLPGSRVAKERNGTAKVLARVLSHPEVGVPAALTIQNNKGVVKELTNPSDQSQLTLEFELPVRESQWIAAHTVCTNGAVAHTTPVYVTVDGQPSWDVERGPAIIEDRIAKLRAVENEFSDGSDTRSRGMVKRMRKAIQFYTDLKAKMEQAQISRGT